MAQAQDTTKRDQAARAKLDDQVAQAQREAGGAGEPETDAARDKRIAADRARARAAAAVVEQAVARGNAGDCPVVVDDDRGPGSGAFCAGKLGHEGKHAA